jgi:selT/selW/selH-like putative selenoprotein
VAEISTALGLKAELIRGGGGVFDVKADDAVIFSKHREERFPENADVIEGIKAAISDKP